MRTDTQRGADGHTGSCGRTHRKLRTGTQEAANGHTGNGEKEGVPPQLCADIICAVRIKSLSLPLMGTSVSQRVREVSFYVKRKGVYGPYLLHSNLANLTRRKIWQRKTPTEVYMVMPHPLTIGRHSYIIWRGLTALLIPTGGMREPECGIGECTGSHAFFVSGRIRGTL